ncbi:MAG: hypothetical protein K6F31_10130, partial [Acetatifactor sp.]|nr:hypothetical protein [Acetatifactor sp.]
DQLRRLGGGSLIDNGAVHRTITLALQDAGLEKPYDLVYSDGDTEVERKRSKPEVDELMPEFEWAFGAEETGSEKAKKKNAKHGEIGKV